MLKYAISCPVENALYGSFLPTPSKDLFPLPAQRLQSHELPGAVVCLKEPIKLNEGRKKWKLKVVNEGDRPIQVNPKLIWR
jgi:urease